MALLSVAPAANATVTIGTWGVVEAEKPPPEPGPPRVCVCGGHSGSSGRLPPEIIQHTMRANYGRFRACHLEAQMRRPGVRGRITLGFLIGRSGRTYMQRAESHGLDAAAVRCMSAAVTALRFSPLAASVVVRYPIRFDGGTADPEPAIVAAPTFGARRRLRPRHYWTPLTLPTTGAVVKAPTSQL